MKHVRVLINMNSLSYNVKELLINKTYYVNVSKIWFYDTNPPRYSWNIVESDVKHYYPTPPPTPLWHQRQLSPLINLIIRACAGPGFFSKEGVGFPVSFYFILAYNLKSWKRLQEEFKDIKGVVRIRKLKKDRQHNDQKVKKDSQHNDQKVKKDSQHNDQKVKKDSQHNDQKVKKDRQHNDQKVKKDRQHNGQKRKVHNDKQRSTKHTHKAKDRVTIRGHWS